MVVHCSLLKRVTYFCFPDQHNCFGLVVYMPPPRRLFSPAPLRRQLRERSAAVGHRFQRQQDDASNVVDNDVHLLKREPVDAQLKLDRANAENVFLKRLFDLKMTDCRLPMSVMESCRDM